MKYAHDSIPHSTQFYSRDACVGHHKTLTYPICVAKCPGGKKTERVYQQPLLGEGDEAVVCASNPGGYHVLDAHDSGFRR